MDSAKVGPKVKPSMSTWSWKSIPSTVTGSVNAPAASAFDFVGLRRAPVAYSKHRIAWCILAKAAGWETKNVTSSAYARTGINCLDLAICNPGRFSSGERMRGCRQSAYRTMLKGRTFLIPLRIDMGSAKTPLTCTEVVAWSHRVCILSMNRWLIPYRLKTWNSYWWETRSKALLRYNVRMHKGTPITWDLARIPRTLKIASKIEFPGTPQNWLPCADRRECAEGDGPEFEPVVYIPC